MIEAADIRTHLSKLWNNGRLLKEWLIGAEHWPLALACGTPGAAQLLDRYGEVQAWIARLESESREGRAYRIEYAERRLQKLGLQRLPTCIWIDNREQALALIGKTPAFEQFTDVVTQTASHPALHEWLARKPLLALSYAQDWPRLLKLCEWLQSQPRPSVYLRQIDLPGIDTKFIETRTGILSELFDVVLPIAAVDGSALPSPRHRFAHRYGFLHEQPPIRLRLLDRQIIAHYRGMSDITLQLDEFQRLDPPCKLVFVTENKTNGLAFPSVCNALVVFGLGYGVDALKDVAWLQDKQLIYWGDIDTHGYHMLSRLRSYWPHTRSLLMSEYDLKTWAELAVPEPADTINLQMPGNLLASETAAFAALRSYHHGIGLRIEQERLPYLALQQALLSITPTYSPPDS